MQHEATSHLWERLRRRDPSAYEQLVRAHHVSVRAYLATRLLDRSSVDDVAQDVFVEAVRSIDRYRGDSNLSTWLLGIARNRALQHTRKEGRRRKRDVVASGLDDGSDGQTDDVVAFESRMERLRDCLEALAPSSRTLVRRHYFGGEALARLAAESDRKESALRMMLLRIRKVLRRCLDGGDPQESEP